MLKLERVEIQGFKSFYEKVDLAFPGSVTAVVGPNGCGKSNICDAVAWALGEQSARILRGERMDKNELFPESDPRAEEKFRVGKLTLGYVYDFPRESRLRIGVGGLVSRYAIPAELTSVYGNPTSFMLFARLKI